jgi:hypothetical protein
MSELLDEDELAIIEYEKQNDILDPKDLPLDIKRLLHKYYGTNLPQLTNKQATDLVEMIATPGILARRSTAIICTGEGTEDIDPCPYQLSCPLVAAKSPPLGSKCPFEEVMIDKYMELYMTELEVRPENIIEMAQLKDVVTIDLLLQRSSGVLADQGLSDENVVGVIQKPGQEATVLFRKDLSHAMMAMDKMLMRKERILKSLRATRESRSGDETKHLDPATLLMKIRNKKEGIEDAE